MTEIERVHIRGMRSVVKMFADEYDALVAERDRYRRALEVLAKGRPWDIRDCARDAGLEERQVYLMTRGYVTTYKGAMEYRGALIAAMKQVARAALEAPGE